MPIPHGPVDRTIRAALVLLAGAAPASAQFQSGACCFPSGQCVITFAQICEIQGGVYHGHNSGCLQSCPQGGCCLRDGTCIVTTALDCVQRQGAYRGNGEPCHATLCGPTTLFGVDAAGNMVRINKATGQATLVGFGTLHPSHNAAAANSRGMIFSHSGNAQLVRLDTYTGIGSTWVFMSGFPSGYGIRAMAFDHHDQLYAVLSEASTSAEDLLATINTTTGVVTVVGGMGQTSLQGLDIRSDGAAYASGADGVLYTVLLFTGDAMPVSGISVGPDGQSLQFDRDGTLLAARDSLRRINLSTGAVTVVGPTGRDIRGLAAVSGYCYANCDRSTTPPILNVNDFICFQSRFAAGSPYANCDGSTAAPVLNVNDFICFQSQFAAGCP